MKRNFLHTACLSLALVLPLFTGCSIPSHFEETRDVGIRTNWDNEVCERIVERFTATKHFYPFTVEGPQTQLLNYKVHYFSVGVNSQPVELPFLRRDLTTRSVFKPVEQTNYWVLVELPAEIIYNGGSRASYKLAFTVFNPQGMLHQKNMAISDFPEPNSLSFSTGNQIVTYKSGNDHYIYDVLENSLNKSDSPK